MSVSNDSLDQIASEFEPAACSDNDPNSNSLKRKLHRVQSTDDVMEITDVVPFSYLDESESPANSYCSHDKSSSSDSQFNYQCLGSDSESMASPNSQHSACSDVRALCLSKRESDSSDEYLVNSPDISIGERLHDVAHSSEEKSPIESNSNSSSLTGCNRSISSTTASSSSSSISVSSSHNKMDSLWPNFSGLPPAVTAWSLLYRDICHRAHRFFTPATDLVAMTDAAWNRISEEKRRDYEEEAIKLSQEVEGRHGSGRHREIPTLQVLGDFRSSDALHEPDTTGQTRSPLTRVPGELPTDPSLRIPSVSWNASCKLSAGDCGLTRTNQPDSLNSGFDPPVAIANSNANGFPPYYSPINCLLEEGADGGLELDGFTLDYHGVDAHDDAWALDEEAADGFVGSCCESSSSSSSCPSSRGGGSCANFCRSSKTCTERVSGGSMLKHARAATCSVPGAVNNLIVPLESPATSHRSLLSNQAWSPACKSGTHQFEESQSKGANGSIACAGYTDLRNLSTAHLDSGVQHVYQTAYPSRSPAQSEDRPRILSVAPSLNQAHTQSHDFLSVRHEGGAQPPRRSLQNISHASQYTDYQKPRQGTFQTMETPGPVHQQAASSSNEFNFGDEDLSNFGSCDSRSALNLSSILNGNGSRRSKKNPAAPKRPLTAYNYFFQEERERLKARFGPNTVSFGALGRMIAAQWPKVEGEARERFEYFARRDRERYVQEMALWDPQWDPQTLGSRKRRKLMMLHQKSYHQRPSQQQPTLTSKPLMLDHNRLYSYPGYSFRAALPEPLWLLDARRAAPLPPPNLAPGCHTLESNYVERTNAQQSEFCTLEELAARELPAPVIKSPNRELPISGSFEDPITSHGTVSVLVAPNGSTNTEGEGGYGEDLIVGLFGNHYNTSDPFSATNLEWTIIDELHGNSSSSISDSPCEEGADISSPADSGSLPLQGQQLHADQPLVAPKNISEKKGFSDITIHDDDDALWENGSWTIVQ